MVEQYDSQGRDRRVKLYHFAPSTASLRVRIALAHKRINYTKVSVSLALGEHREAAYQARNPQRLLPTLELDDGRALVQSLPIIEYLEECYPDPPLMPADPYERSYVRAIAQMVACEMHPLNNMRVIKHLRNAFGVEQDVINVAWAHPWLKDGFDAIEAVLLREALSGNFCLGHAFTIADICVVGQAASAARFGFSMQPYPQLTAIIGRCEELAAVRAAKVND